MENENFDGDESGQEIGDDENEQKLSTALDHIKKCEICNTNICIKFKQLVKMLTKHQLVQFLEKKLREDQKEIVEAERRRKAPHSPYSQIAKSLLLSKRKVHTNFSSDLLSPPPQRIPPTSPQFVQSMPSQNVQNPSGIILELDAFLRDYGLNRPNADDFANTRVDDVMRMLREPPYEASLSIQDRLNNFRFAFINSELFHGFDRGEIENEITRLIGEHSRANAIPPAENNDNSEPILVQQQQQPPMPQRAKRRLSKILPHRKSFQRKQNGCYWPAKIGLTKQKNAQLYIYFSNELYGYVFQKMLNKAKCWRCQSTWNYSSKERCFTEDPELGHRHHECQRLISQIRLDQLQRIFLVRISGQGLTNENADANLYLELFKQLLDEKLEPETSVYYEKYKSFKDSIENALFNNNNYNEQIEMIDPYFMIPEIHGPGQEDDGQESDFDAGNSDSEEDLERTLQNLEISALESSPPPSQQQQQHTPPSQQQHLPPPPQQQQYPSPPAQQQQQHTPPSQQQQHPPPPPQQPDDAQQQQHPQLHLGRHPPPNIQQQRNVLPPEALELIQKAWDRTQDENEIMVDSRSFKIKRHELLQFSELQWLGDEVVDFYLNLIVKRSMNDDSNLPKIFAFPMVFFANLCSGGYEKVKRYTRKEDVFKKEIWLVPILRQKHWTLVTVDFRNQQIDYCDSLMGEYKEVFEILLSYMSSEFKDKKNEDFEINGWTFQHKKNIPTQLNGSDCGIFVCKYAEYVSRRAEFDFDQQDMPHFRKEMVWEILQQRLMNE